MAKAGESIEAYLYSLLLSKLNSMVISINKCKLCPCFLRYQTSNKGDGVLKLFCKFKLNTYYGKLSPLKFQVNFSRPLSLWS